MPMLHCVTMSRRQSSIGFRPVSEPAIVPSHKQDAYATLTMAVAQENEGETHSNFF